MVDDPWGNTAVSALRWSFNMLGRSAVLPSVLGNLRGAENLRAALSKLDRSAQAAVIRQQVDLLGAAHPVAAAYLWCAYLPKPMWERQPGRKAKEMVDRFPGERGKCTQDVAWWLMGMQGTGQHRIRGYQEIVAQYTLSDHSEPRLQRLLGVSHEKCYQLRTKCFAELEDLDRRALALMDERLNRSGLIGDDITVVSG